MHAYRRTLVNSERLGIAHQERAKLHENFQNLLSGYEFAVCSWYHIKGVGIFFFKLPQDVWFSVSIS